MFSDVDGGFTKTRIPLKNIYETYPVSRSQAKRLCNRLENFMEVELDFAEIEEIGQGFAHQIFCVFQNDHPGIELIPVNMSTEVEKMIYHVKQSINSL
ncbi:MAG: STAS-like domain-containing protein [Lachnospiraceae bacterium]|nr:STAS-like domain-containing protein [Lachnospiraceae bacterium]